MAEWNLGGAVFSSCEQYRYVLYRHWGDKPVFHRLATPDVLPFIGLNPSTATATEDDPTVSRCINFAKRNGFQGMYMLNLFAYRATIPGEMKMQMDPVGPDNNTAIMDILKSSLHVVLAWGNHGSHLGRSNEMKELLNQAIWLENIWCFGVTNQDEPIHPLYQPSNAQFVGYPLLK